MNARRSTHAVVVAVLLLTAQLSAGAETVPPLAAPKAPKAEVRGQPGNRTLYYWAWAADARGHSAYSSVTIVSNAPEVLSEQNAVEFTVAPVPNAVSYAILTSRAEPPADLKIAIKAKGDRTFYYWMQARSGHTVWSPLSGPFEAAGCAEAPTNLLSWGTTGALQYFVYRTATPEPPFGYRSCLVGDRLATNVYLDRFPIPSTRIIEPAGNPADTPQGLGLYLVGVSKGEPIVDRGQPLGAVTAYDFNTTAPENCQFKPGVKAYAPSGDEGAYQFDYNNTLPTPKEGWDVFPSLSVHQYNKTGGENLYPSSGLGIERGNGKNTHMGLFVQQFNYTASQKCGISENLLNYGNGDCVGLGMAIDDYGQSRTCGDEGTEFFSLHMTRRLETARIKVAADAPRGSVVLALEKWAWGMGRPTDRGLANVSQAYAKGRARVEGDVQSENFERRVRGQVCAVGEDVVWTSDMEGWAISFDADTRPDGVRQWYRVDRFIGPTRLKIFAFTAWSAPGNCYLGKAVTNGSYRLCPYTEVREGRAVGGERVAPLPTAWRKGDAVEVIAGPQTTFHLGCWEMQGKMLPQDVACGLGIFYGGDKDPSTGTFSIYGNPDGRWPSAVELHTARSGMMLDDVGVGITFRTNCPAVFQVIGENDAVLMRMSRDESGVYLEGASGLAGRAVGLTTNGLVLPNGGIAGNARTRGQTMFSGDGKTTVFRVVFPSPHAARPFVVASSSLPIGMGVTEMETAGCTVTFATPPAAGKDNVVVTWMTQE